MDIENVKCTLNNIVTTLGLILEDMGEEHVPLTAARKRFIPAWMMCISRRWIWFRNPP